MKRNKLTAKDIEDNLLKSREGIDKVWQGHYQNALNGDINKDLLVMAMEMLNRADKDFYKDKFKIGTNKERGLLSEEEVKAVQEGLAKN